MQMHLGGQTHDLRQGNQFEHQTTVLMFEAFLGREA